MVKRCLPLVLASGLTRAITPNPSPKSVKTPLRAARGPLACLKPWYTQKINEYARLTKEKSVSFRRIAQIMDLHEPLAALLARLVHLLEDDGVVVVRIVEVEVVAGI